MLKLYLVTVILLTATCCSKAQNKTNFIRNFNYYAISSNRWLYEIAFSKDSLVVCQRKEENNINKWHFDIIDKEKNGKYHIVYLKYSPSKYHPQDLRYGSFVYYFSRDKKQLRYLSNDSYRMLEQAKADWDTTNYDNKYLEPAYLGTYFKTLLTLPDVMSADSGAMQSIMKEYANNFKVDMVKMQNTPTEGLYGSMFVQDVLSTTLISQHYSPMVTIADFEIKAAAYHIPVPKFNEKYRNHKFEKRRYTSHNKADSPSTSPKTDFR